MHGRAEAAPEVFGRDSELPSLRGLVAADRRAGALLLTGTAGTGKTMPKWPHEYVLIWRSPDPWLHLRVVAFIRSVGERRRWGRHFHHYWTWGDHEYWAMPPRETILNRRRLDWPG